jgi:hypothetical protein
VPRDFANRAPGLDAKLSQKLAEPILHNPAISLQANTDRVKPFERVQWAAIRGHIGIHSPLVVFPEEIGSVEINSTLAFGSTAAAKAMAARLRSAGFPEIAFSSHGISVPIGVLIILAECRCQLTS